MELQRDASWEWESLGWEAVVGAGASGGFTQVILHDGGAEGGVALHGLDALGEVALGIAVLQDVVMFALGEAGIDAIASVRRHCAFAEDLRFLALDFAVAADGLESGVQIGIPDLVGGDFVAGECQLIAKFGLAIGPVSHFVAELCFAGKIADRIVFFAVEIFQGNWFCWLREVIFGDDFFLMDGILKGR